MRARLRLPLFFSVLVASSILLDGRLVAEPVGEDSGPVSELSRPIGEGRPVSSGRGPTLGESSGIVNSPPVSGSSVGSMISGPVSEISSGAVTSYKPMTGGGSITENSAGAVTKDIASPLGEPIADPLRDLGPLQARLRTLRQQLSLPSAPANPETIVAQDTGTIEEESLDGGGNQAPGAEAQGTGAGAAPGENVEEHADEPPAAAAPAEEEDDAAEEIHEAPAAPEQHDQGAAETGDHGQPEGGEDDLPAEGF